MDALAARSVPSSASILVLNYNGIEHLDDCLRTALEAATSAGVPCRVVLVDNRSTDGSVVFTRERFPDVEVVVSPVNDFLFSLNDVVRARPEDVVVIVNNDMRFDPAFVSALLPRFANPSVFAAGSAIRTWDGTADTVGPRCAALKHCWFYKEWRLERQEASETLDVCGGAAAYRRWMFVDLGGFDPLYRPGYYEDLDLSARAWMRGWLSIYEPASLAYHKVSVSMVARYGDRGKARMLYRNHVLFTLKNVGDAAFLLGFLAMLPARAVKPLLRGDSVPIGGFLRALPRLPRALAARASARGRLPVERFASVTPLEPAIDARG